MNCKNMLACIALLAGPAIAAAAPLYSDTFNVDSSASWNINKAVVNSSGVSVTLPSGDASSSAQYAYDYTALMGIPAAPNSASPDALHNYGLRLRSNLGAVSSVNGATSRAAAVSVSPLGLSLTAPYVMQFDVWGNWVSGGANSTELWETGVGTTGTKTQWIFDPTGAVWFGDTRDGGAANSDYRIYLNNGNQAATTGLYAAGNVAASLDNLNSYYSFMPSQGVPAAQVTLFPTQAGLTTPAGSDSFAWHTVKISNDGTNITKYIDNVLIATVPLSNANAIMNGTNIFLGSSDTNNGGSSGNGLELNFDLFDNLVINVPEPATAGLLLLASLPLLAMRRKLRH